MLTRAVLSGMLERNRGHLVFTSSLVGTAEEVTLSQLESPAFDPANSAMSRWTLMAVHLLLGGHLGRASLPDRKFVADVSAMIVREPLRAHVMGQRGAGETTRENDEFTGARPGRLVRR